MISVLLNALPFTVKRDIMIDRLDNKFLLKKLHAPNVFAVHQRILTNKQ